MKKISSDTMVDALVEQWGMEMYNANVYSTIYAYLMLKGLPNIAKMFLGQAKEELSHAEYVLNILVDVGGKFRAPKVLGFECNGGEDIFKIAEIFWGRESETLASLVSIKGSAEQEDDQIVYTSISEMIKWQRVEMAESGEFFEKASHFAGDWKACVLWDASFDSD